MWFRRGSATGHEATVTIQENVHLEAQALVSGILLKIPNAIMHFFLSFDLLRCLLNAKHQRHVQFWTLVYWGHFPDKS